MTENDRKIKRRLGHLKMTFSAAITMLQNLNHYQVITTQKSMTDGLIRPLYVPALEAGLDPPRLVDRFEGRLST